MNCCNDLQKLQKQFVKLLIANGDIMINKHKNKNSNIFFNAENGIENQLRNEGFSKKVIKRVASEMRRHGRPSSNFSKKTGLIKKN